MRFASVFLMALLAALVLAGCHGKSRFNGDPVIAQCADGVDNDGDGLTDFPADTSCSSAADTSETDPPPPPQCSDGLDNDADTLTDFPNDPGCTSAQDTDESNPAPLPACSDGTDNDMDGKTDFPDEPGCDSAADTDETDPVPPRVCSDGLDNDNDTFTDYPDDPGCDFAADTDEADPVATPTRTRYQMNNQCWALKSNGNGNYVVRTANGYTATATDIGAEIVEPFFMKPSALGKYLFYNRNRQLMSVGTAPALVNVASASATDNSEWTIVGVGDGTDYPPTPEYDREPTPEEVVEYHGFNDPNLPFSEFTVSSAATGTNLAVDGSGNLLAASPAANPSQSFSFEPLAANKCMNFPEAQSNFIGTPFKGTQQNGTVLGHADVHVHISASTFLGGAQWGQPYHKFGVEHALGDCSAAHGEGGEFDLVGGLFGFNQQAFPGDVAGGTPFRQFNHDTRGWPDFPDWPGRDQLTHEAIYWKWLERSWASGLRVVVNDLVDNETLCELQRNASGDSTRDCNSMNNAGQQAGTMYGMEDYIDAQYGGRGAGFFQIVHDPQEARDVIEDGKMAVVLGIEISELFDCKLHYSPLRLQRPFEETGAGGIENFYECTMAEGATEAEDPPNSIRRQMRRIHDWGVRQVISIHEFDNAFGGNGIFDGLILNMGNREDSGGIPSGDIATLIALFSPDTNADIFQAFVENLPTTETPTGEWWTTYDCPIENPDDGTPTPAFSGYLWGSRGGSEQSFLSPPLCVFTGQEGRAGGTTPCYPAGVRQCNARWMTPIGLYTYGLMMKMGFLIDWDHMEMGMKSQLLELTEAQDPVYPIVSTHGTFGGATVSQTRRQLKNGGFVYPSNGSSLGYVTDMNETETIYLDIPEAERPALFGFGYGTDTNGLSSQTGPRGNIEAGKEIVYDDNFGFTLFAGGIFSQAPLSGMFANATGVMFLQPSSADADGEIKRRWHEDMDGNAHHGMLSDFVQEIVLEGEPKHIQHLFNSAEAYLRTWARTEAASTAINAVGLISPPDPNPGDGIPPPLRAAPKGTCAKSGTGPGECPE